MNEKMSFQDRGGDAERRRGEREKFLNDEHEEAKWLLNKKREGAISTHQLQLAAYLGDTVAQQAIIEEGVTEVEPASENDAQRVVLVWLNKLREYGGTEGYVAVHFGVLHDCLPAYQAWSQELVEVEDQSIVAVMTAIREYLNDPTSENLKEMLSHRSTVDQRVVVMRDRYREIENPEEYPTEESPKNDFAVAFLQSISKLFSYIEGLDDANIVNSYTSLGESISHACNSREIQSQFNAFYQEHFSHFIINDADIVSRILDSGKLVQDRMKEVGLDWALKDVK